MSDACECSEYIGCKLQRKNIISGYVNIVSCENSCEKAVHKAMALQVNNLGIIEHA